MQSSRPTGSNSTRRGLESQQFSSRGASTEALYTIPGIGNIPKDLQRIPQWVGWRYGKARASGKRAKDPVNPHTGRKVDPYHPKAWATFEEALRAVERYNLDGVGFVFTENDPYAGVDFDNIIDPDTGEIEPWALEIVEELDSYTEVSPSGTGLKVWLRASKPGPRCKAEVKGAEVEVYDSKRFFAFTGRRFGETHDVEERQDQLEDLYRRLFPEEGHYNTPNAAPAGEGFEGEDSELVAMLKRSRDGEKFQAIFEGGSTSYHGGNHSKADMYVIGKLAWATAGDAKRVERIFNSSALAQRSKWQKRPDYRQRTIQRAIQNLGPSAYSGKPSQALQESLEAAERWAGTQPWSGKGGGRNRHAFGALVDTGWVHGKVRPNGDVEFYAGQRDLMLASGIGSFDGIAAALADLREEGAIRCLHEGTRDAAATYVLPAAHYRSTQSPNTPPCVDLCAPATRRLLRQLRRVRDSAPMERKERRRDGARQVTTARDVSRGALYQKPGKERALLLEKVFLAGSEGLSRRDLARRTGKRSNDLRRRILPYLLELELIVEVREDVYAAADDLGRRLDEVLEGSGCVEVGKIQCNRFHSEREGRPNRVEVAAEEAPTHDELHEYRRSYPERRRRGIEQAIARLFAAKPEYRACRTGQITCALVWYLPSDFPRGPDGVPKDSEVEAILSSESGAA